MDLLFLGVIIFLFLLAIFDLSVGVSNDAANFMNSAVGAKAASFRKIIIVAGIGVFVGAATSNGMMDVVRHGIFRPEHFTFYELICIFMAVMVTDVILLDIYNTLGLPTSTTVSLVFELLGATFAIAMLKLRVDTTGLTLDNLLNTGQAMTVILAIFLSVAIALFFGTVVQFLTRLIFTFNYRHKLSRKIGLFGGVAATCILYFLVIKGAKDLTFMTPDIKAFIAQNTLLLVAICFVVCTVVMQVLHWMGVNVFKVVVLLGTFALAMAFAGNDLVNFIGVPLSGFASYQDYMANGAGDAMNYRMGALNESANTPILFLLGAGVIMVVSLATSKKAHKVIQTGVGLGSQTTGEEMFGSSRIARRLVRSSLSFASWVVRITPMRVRHWVGTRLDVNQAIIENGAAFDLVRGAVNLTLSSILIAFGTSLKLPLSTTYITFMVAMGTSLADRAWGRESAVFRITGVISVIGGWFITAGVAFIGAGLIVLLMHWGGSLMIIAIGLVAIVLLVRSHLRFKDKSGTAKAEDELFRAILATDDKARTWELLQRYLSTEESALVRFVLTTYREVTTAFMTDDVRPLQRAERAIYKQKDLIKSTRRKQTLCLRRLEHTTAIEKTSWFHLAYSAAIAMYYNLRRINETCKEHVENNFHPLPDNCRASFEPIFADICSLLEKSADVLEDPDTQTVSDLRREADRIKMLIGDECHRTTVLLREGNADAMSVCYVYLNLLQESQEMVSSLRKLLKAGLGLKYSYN